MLFRSAEAVIEALVLVHRERWGFLVVERAQARVFLALLGELHLAADDGRERHPRLDLFEKGLGERHGGQGCV